MKEPINRLTHVPLLVNNQEKALDFFVNKLGMVKKDDEPMEKGARWLTVMFPKQPELEIVLQAVDWGVTDRTAAERAKVVGKQEGFCLACNNVTDTCKRLKENGVEIGKIEDMPWGKQAAFKDIEGNKHLLVEQRRFRA